MGRGGGGKAADRGAARSVVMAGATASSCINNAGVGVRHRAAARQIEGRRRRRGAALPTIARSKAAASEVARGSHDREEQHLALLASQHSAPATAGGGSMISAAAAAAAGADWGAPLGGRSGGPERVADECDGSPFSVTDHPPPVPRKIQFSAVPRRRPFFSASLLAVAANNTHRQQRTARRRRVAPAGWPG